MALFGKRMAGFASHPVFLLRAGMPRAVVVERIGPPTETRTSAEVMAEFAGAVIDPARVDPEEYWSYSNVPDGYHLAVLLREQHLVEVRVRKNGSQELVARIDDRGVAAAKSYRFALRAQRL